MPPLNVQIDALAPLALPLYRRAPRLLLLTPVMHARFNLIHSSLSISLADVFADDLSTVISCVLVPRLASLLFSAQVPLDRGLRRGACHGP